MRTLVGVGGLIVSLITWLSRNAAADHFSQTKISPFLIGKPPPRIYYVVVMYLVALGFAILGVSVLLGAPLQEW
jgi:hypothetical protein